LKEWPDGTVRAQSMADGTLRENILIKTQLKMTKKDDKLIFDFRGSAPAFANRPNNSVLAAIKGMISQMFLSFIWPDIPRNQAVLNPVEFIVDNNSIYNASYDVPNSQGMMTLFPSFTVSQMCVTKFLYNTPERYTKVLAPWYNMITTCIYGGVTQYGEIVGNLAADLNGMSGGAREDMDGEHSIAPIFAPMAEQGEQELVEEEVPLMQLARNIMKDNQAFGKYRGGQGYEMIYTHKNSPMWGYMFTTIGSKYPTVYGIFGGYACPTY